MTHDLDLRQQLIAQLEERRAHLMFDEAVADFPVDKINTRPPNVTYTPWHLLEHLRISQWDILDYMRNPQYQYQKWPEDYWPAQDSEADAAQWNASIEAFRADLQAIKAIINDPAADLYAQIPHGEAGHTILREVLVVASHNAYHIGELGILRQVMDAWPSSR
jgi:hypothetical protein